MLTLNRVILAACTLAGFVFFIWCALDIGTAYGALLGAFLGWGIHYVPTWMFRRDW